MMRPVLIALTNPVSRDREVEFNTWYNEVHAPDLLELPGVCSITRYRTLAQLRPGSAEPQHRYLAIYDLDDPTAAAQALLAKPLRFRPSDALSADAYALTFEPIFTMGS